VITKNRERIDEYAHFIIAHERLKKVIQDRLIHLDHLADIRLAMPSLLALLNLPLKFILVNISYHQLYAQVSVITIRVDGVPGDQKPCTVPVGSVSRRNLIPKCIRPRDQSRDRGPIREPAARNITRVARERSSNPLVLVVVWVVNDARFDATRAPTERSVTLCAVHLVTPVNLENHRGALRAISRVLREELGRRQIVRVAHVLVIPILSTDLVTVGARPIFTHATLPGCTQKTLTVFVRTRPHKLPTLLVNLTPVKPLNVIVMSTLKVLYIHGEARDNLVLDKGSLGSVKSCFEFRFELVLFNQAGEGHICD
jgi:hypothetical protein